MREKVSLVTYTKYSSQCKVQQQMLEMNLSISTFQCSLREESIFSLCLENFLSSQTERYTAERTKLKSIHVLVFSPHVCWMVMERDLASAFAGVPQCI